MEYVIGYFILYMIQAILIYGMSFAHFQRRWPEIARVERRGDVLVSMLLALFAAFLPIIGLLLIFILTHGIKYGFKLR